MIIPAIDLQNGEAVRLYKGDYAQKTVYSKNPADIAAQFEQMGAKYLHVVDLDGAKEGRAVNTAAIRAIRERIRIPMQVGGGIRDAETVAYYLKELGINRVILGTSAIAQTTPPKTTPTSAPAPDPAPAPAPDPAPDPAPALALTPAPSPTPSPAPAPPSTLCSAFARDMLATYGPERIVFGVDARDGMVKTAGWLQDGGIHYRAYIEALAAIGARYIVLTDITRDGTLTGPNWALYASVKDLCNSPIQTPIQAPSPIQAPTPTHAPTTTHVPTTTHTPTTAPSAPGLRIIVSGGVSSAKDIVAARDYYGVIVGKAYYEGKVDLAEMMKKRIVACLDIVNDKVVKGVHFVDMNEIGDPAVLAKAYEDQGADEIVLLDITATNEGRDTFYFLIKRVTDGLTVPVTVGGGIRTLHDMKKVIAAGAAKVSVNSAFVKNPNLINEAVATLGKSRIVAAIDAKKTADGFHVFIRGGREDTGLDLIEWAKECEVRGVGEILLTSMDGDGTQEGYDLPMTKAVADSVSIPVTASGGCGTIDDIVTVFNKTGCDAALVASLLHYGKATVADIKARLEKKTITGLLPAIVQDYYTGKVLMLAYVNQESYDYMLTHGETCFWSRSRQCLWHKGETSGNKQKINNIAFDCDEDTLLIQVEQTGQGACHTGRYSCFGDDSHAVFETLEVLYAVIGERQAHPVERSYTNYLFDKGLDKVLKKIGEETAEVIIAAKNQNQNQNRNHEQATTPTHSKPDVKADMKMTGKADLKADLISEIADLAYHLLVMMHMTSVTPADIREKLAQRRQATS